MDLDTIADELYGLPPEDFVATRTVREREARTGGQRELAAQIHRLQKPTTVAWLANQLVRTHPDEIRPLLELGDALREASAVLHGEELRRLSQQQTQLVHELVRQAKAIARASGRRVTEDVERGLEDTLRAALADPGLGGQLAAARLTEGLQHAGFALPDAVVTKRRMGSGAHGQADRPSGRPRTEQRRAEQRRAEQRERAEQRRAEQRERADRAVAAAQDAADDAATGRDQARAALESARATAHDLDERARRLEAEFARLRDQRVQAERAERRARTAYDHDEKVASDAARRLADAIARRQRLDRTAGKPDGATS